MGIFKGLKDAKAAQGGNYERIGHYLERIDKVKTDTSRKGAEFLAIEKTVVRVIDNAQGKGHTLGESVTHMFTMKKEYAETTLGNIKAMIAAILALPPDQVTDEVGEMISSERQPLAGMLIEVNNQTITTKKMTLFTQVRYLHSFAPDKALKLLTPEEIARFYPDNFLDKQLAAMNAAPVSQTPTPAPIAAPVPAPVPQVGVLQKLPVGVTPPGMMPCTTPGYVFATQDGGKTWTFVPA